MIKKIEVLIFLVTTTLAVANGQENVPSDRSATIQTVNLYKNLKNIVHKGFMIGHQDDLAYGVNWKYQPGRSDVKDVTGDYPAVYGWELGHIEIGSEVNLDSVPFNKMREYIQEGYERGGVITISWHGNNPLTGQTAWSKEKGTAASILPGGSKNLLFNSQLNKIASFMLSLKGNTGELIPVLFRPFHEHTGGWFWWGNVSTSNEEYKALFRYTVGYLKEKCNVHNLLYVYNTGSEFSTEKDYLERYPGDDVVDVFSFDTYQFGNAGFDSSFVKALDLHLSVIEKLAAEKSKLAVIGEVGYNQIPYAKWWTNSLLQGIGTHKIAYVLFWRNAGLKPIEKEVEYFVPFKGQASEKDFIDFYNLPQTLFQSDISYDLIYK